MKNLILIALTLISLNSFGQTQIQYDLAILDTIEANCIILDDIIQEPLISIMNEYIDYCNSDTLYNRNFLGKDYFIIKKKDPDFIDFIEWLKSKY